MNFCQWVAKYVIYVINSIFMISGLLMIIFGTIVLFKLGQINHFTDGDMQTIPIAILVVGCVVTIVAFYGCSGAIENNRVCLFLHIFSLTVLVVVQVGLLIWIYLSSEQVFNNMNKALEGAFKMHNGEPGYSTDTLQLVLKCCGLDSYEEYGDSVPESCCGFLVNCTIAIYSKRMGCRELFVDYWNNRIYLVRVFGILMIFAEVIALALACCYFRALLTTEYDW